MYRMSPRTEEARYVAKIYKIEQFVGVSFLKDTYCFLTAFSKLSMMIMPSKSDSSA